jgi:hypothetical protein
MSATDVLIDVNSGLVAAAASASVTPSGGSALDDKSDKDSALVAGSIAPMIGSNRSSKSACADGAAPNGDNPSAKTAPAALPELTPRPRTELLREALCRYFRLRRIIESSFYYIQIDITYRLTTDTANRNGNQ